MFYMTLTIRSSRFLIELKIIKHESRAKNVLIFLMHSVYMNIIGIHAFKTSPTLVTMIDLRLNMFTLHVLIDIAFQFAGVTTV